MSNTQQILNQIKLLNSDDPYIPETFYMSQNITDMDHHPYSKFFRGEYNLEEPKIFDRNAGWRPVKNYVKIPVSKECKFRTCFRPACSVTLRNCENECVSEYHGDCNCSNRNCLYINNY